MALALAAKAVLVVPVVYRLPVGKQAQTALLVMLAKPTGAQQVMAVLVLPVAPVQTESAPRQKLWLKVAAMAVQGAWAVQAASVD